MKKLLALLLALCMLLALCACGSTTDKPSADTEQPAPAQETTPDNGKADVTEPEQTPAVDLGPVVETIGDMLFAGEPVPNFTVTLADGSVFTLGEALAKYDCVMINAWGTWCGPCVMEMPVMQSAYEKYADKIGLVCLSDADTNEDIAAFQAENDLQGLPLGHDSVGISAAIVVEGYPTTIIVDKFGNFAYYECGSILDESGFTRMWDYFLSDSYTESSFVDSIPGEAYAGNADTAEALTAALCADGSVAVDNTADEEAWPFLVCDAGVVNANALAWNTYASLVASFAGKAGDVFAFDYTADFEALYDSVEISVNGDVVKTLLTGGEGTYALELTAEGSYEVVITYSQQASESDTDTTGTVVFSNMRVVSGDAAAELLAAQPVYPYALTGYDYQLEVLSEGAKKVQLILPEGTNNETIAYYGAVEMYIVPAEFGSFRMVLGDAYDAEQAYGYGDYDTIINVASLCEMDETGFLFDCALSGVELGGYSNTYVTIIPDVNDSYTGTTIYVFNSEENMNYFCAYEVYNMRTYEVMEGVSWVYEDGTLPSTDAIAQEPSEFLYNIFLVDEAGEPVDGVMINVCTDENCTPTNTEGGYYGFNADPYAYVIHVLKIPEGYSFDTTQEFVMDAEGDVLIITIPHA